MTGRDAGWDSKAIKQIADQHYGGYAGLADAHGWPAQGSQIMPGINGRIKEVYGGVSNFVAAHHPGLELTPEEMWDGRFSIMLTSFWGWSPETWGTVGFTEEGRRNTVVAEATDPFLAVIYVTKNAPKHSAALRGKVTGFYLVSHIPGYRDEFTHSQHHGKDAEKWRHSLKAIRAFSFLPEYQLSIDELDATIANRALAVAQWGEFIAPNLTERLKKIPYVEIPVFGINRHLEPRIVVPKAKRGMVRAGPANRSGYLVSGEPRDTEKELYVLRLQGDTDSYLGEAAQGRSIYKIGLSISPMSRLDAFRKSMPRGAYEWVVHWSTREDGDDPYPSFEAAEVGETAMKTCLVDARAKWLGGEFYAATDEQIKSAWLEGRKRALGWRGK